ncbi:MAG: MFS transporter, partial [Candidatus Bathyarchaeia archaeon]
MTRKLTLVKGSPWFALLAVFLVQTFSAAVNFSIPPLTPFIQSTFALTRAQIGLLISALFIGSAVMSIPAGGLTDRIGVRRMLFISLASIGVLLVLAAQSRSFPEMFTLLLVMGVAYSGVAPSTSKGVLEWFETKRRATAMGVKQSGVTIGSLGVALTLPWLALTLGWRLSMSILGVVACAAGVAVFWLYREQTLNRVRLAPSKLGGRGALRATLRNRNLLLFSSLALVFAATQLSLVTYLVLYLTEMFAFTVVLAGFMLALVNGAGTVGRIFFGYLSDRVFRGSRKKTMVLVGSFTTAMTLIFSLVSPGMAVWIILPVIAALGLVALGHNAVMMT